jgi:galactokinase
VSQQITAAADAFREQFGAAPLMTASAPGRVNLIGGHTDYNDGFVLPAAIDRRIRVLARPRDDGTVRAYTRKFDDRHSFSLDDLRPGEGPRWAQYVAGVLGELHAADGLPGMDLLIDGDLPMGAGLSSSAALELAVGTAACDVGGVERSRDELATLCRRAENEFVGVSCGIMDQFAAAFGEAGSALFLDCRSRDHRTIPFDGGPVRIVVVDTNVKHELADSAYNERLAECREAADRFDGLLDREVDSLRDVSVADFERHAGDFPEPIRSRSEHVVRENERVRTAAEALEDGDLELVGDLLYRSHESLRDRYEVSCEELDRVVAIARETDGAVGARMTGGGFGGSVVCLVRTDAVPAFADRVEREYAAATGVDPDVYECDTADGATARRL